METTDLASALDRFMLQLQADGRCSHSTKQYQRHVSLFARWAACRGLCGNVEAIGHST